MSARNLYTAGFQDLVPVVPPNAELAPTTTLKLASRGKVPGTCRLDGRWVGISGWQDQDPPSPSDIAKWESWGANIGLRADHFPGLDVDVDHSVLAQFVVQEAQKILGPAPIRTSRDPRKLLVYRAEEPFLKQVATIHYGDVEHKVELLGKGRQYLVLGDHPSGSKYGWEGQPLWESSPDDLTIITQEQVREFFDHLREKLHGRAEVEIQGAKDTTPPPQEELKAPSLEALADLVASIPNTFPDRDTYMQVGYAIKAAGGEEAFDVWADWCARWEQGDNEPATVKKDWKGMKPPYRVGWPYLQDLASEFSGYVPAQDEFEADLDTSLPDEQPVTTYSDVTNADGLVTDGTVRQIVQRILPHLKPLVRWVPMTSQWHVWSGEGET